MASASDLATVAYIYKKTYGDGVGDAATREHPLLMHMAKIAKFTGESFRYSIKYGNPQGVSNTFSVAQAGAASSKGLQFEAFRFSKFGVITMKGEAIAASEGNDGALVDLVTGETDGVLTELVDSFAFDLYRDGTGNRGRRLSAATNIITLTVADDVRNFKVGMTVVASANANGSSPRAGSTTVAGVDEDGGTVTLTSAAGITGFADNDFLFRAGDAGLSVEGLEVCTPLVAPVGGDNFRTKDRSVDVARLAGSRVNDPTTVIEENAGLVAVKIGQRGKKATDYYLNPINFWQVARRLNAKVEYIGGGGQFDYGVESMNISTPAGTLKCWADPDCPVTRGRVMRMEDQYIRTLRGLPHIIMDDGRANLRQTADDGVEARARIMANLIQKQTSSHGVHSI